MRIIHLSDLHFGTELPGIVEGLIAHLAQTPADLLIVSGDFTQVGSDEEYIQAGDFLKRVGLPFLCVPGNHDVPRYHFIDRMLRPFARYQKHIHDNLTPICEMDNICVAGINTARRILPHWNWANGAVSRAQLDHLDKAFNSSPARVRILVMHHPLHKVEDDDFKTIVFGASQAINRFKAMGIDLILTGHVHHASVTVMNDWSHHTIFLSASTALSRRLRKSSNGYNVITVKDDKMKIELFSYQQNEFEPFKVFEYPLAKRG